MISHEPREEGRSRENYADSLKVSEQSVETRHRCAWCPVRPSWDIYLLWPNWASFRFSIERATASLRSSERMMLCQKKKQLNALAKTSEKASLPRRKLVSLCARKWNTSAKANMVRDRPNRRSRSVCRKLAGREYSCHRQRKARLRRKHVAKPNAS